MRRRDRSASAKILEQDADREEEGHAVDLRAQRVTYYAILNVSRNATESEIRAAYKHLSLIYHSDRHTDPADKEAATRMFLLIKEAHDTLLDPEKRYIYDTTGITSDGSNDALSQPTWTEEELYEYLQHGFNEHMHTPFHRQNVMSGAMSLGVDISPLIDPPPPLPRFMIFFRRPPPKKASISNFYVQQKMKVALSKTKEITLGGSLTVANGSGAGHFEGSYVNHWNDTTEVEGRLKLGNNGGVALDIIRKLSKDESAVLGTTLSEDGFKIDFAAERQITPQLLATATVTSADALSLGLNLSHKMNKVTTTGSIQSGEKAAIGVQGIYQYADDLFFNASASLKPGKAEMELLLGQRISSRSRLIAGFGLSNQGVSVHLMINRLRQKYYIPITISTLPTFKKILPAVAIPCAIIGLVREYFYKPKMQRRKDRQQASAAEQPNPQQHSNESEAKRHIRFQSRHVERIRRIETETGGLLIQLALFGPLEAIEEIEQQIDITNAMSNPGFVGQDLSIPSQACAANVTDPLQGLVRQSKLNVMKHCYVGIPGFFNPSIRPCVKALKIWYTFQKRAHVVLVFENQDLAIPSQ